MFSSCPLRRSASSTAGLNVGSTSNFSPSVQQNLGASSAACGLTPSSSSRIMACMCACGCMYPPMMPNGPTGSPPRVRNPGMMVWYGYLRGPTSLACPACIEKHAPRSCRQMPVPGTYTPDPKPWYRLWIMEMLLPCPSAQQKYTVSPCMGFPGAYTSARSVTSAARCAAYSLLSSASTGKRMNLGSAM